MKTRVKITNLFNTYYITKHQGSAYTTIIAPKHALTSACILNTLIMNPATRPIVAEEEVK